jgi:hypothetical protein
MDETQEKSVIESDSKEKIGNAIDWLDLLHRLFIDLATTGGHPGHWGYGSEDQVPTRDRRVPRRSRGRTRWLPYP